MKTAQEIMVRAALEKIWGYRDCDPIESYDRESFEKSKQLRQELVEVQLQALAEQGMKVVTWEWFRKNCPTDPIETANCTLENCPRWKEV